MSHQAIRTADPAWRAQHKRMRALAEAVGEWTGIPTAVDGFSVSIESRHRHRAAFEEILSKPWPKDRVCSDDDVDEKIRIRNSWWSPRLCATVWIYERDGKIRHLIDYRQRFAANRLTFWLGTIGASQGWSIEAEMEARTKLRRMIKPHLYEMYETTGSFLESSPRSGITYVLRRARPTIAMAPGHRRNPDADDMRILAVLCLHPLGYYASTWAGAMVPTDDVIAHLSWIRGDEAGFWRHANQHRADAPEAGI